jgi:hypothetical protein
MANQTDPYSQTTVGTATGSVGFFGATGTTIQSVTGTVTTTISQVATSGKWAFATSTAAIALVQAVQDIKAALEAYGLTTEG